MDILAELGRVLGFSFAAGLNLYATVAMLGLASRFGWVTLPPQYRAFDSDLIIYTAIALYVIEFLADKIPWVDSVWDAVHTFVRPVGGAVIAVIALGPATPTLTALAALLGGLVAGSTHVTKAGTRVIANTSPEPFSNWALSLGEDTLVVAIAYLALSHPLVALGVTVALLALMVSFAAVIVRAFRRRFGRSSSRRPSSASVARTACLLALILTTAGLAADGSFGDQARPAGGETQDQPPRPVFRAGANFVRVDVFATKDGQAVTDLTAPEFEVLEDGVPQKVETFEHVRVQTGGAPAARVEPRSIREANEAAADPRSRVFVLFLDTWHMHQTSGYNVRRPLVNLLQRVIGDDDLVAIMRPQMSASDLMFTRRTDQLAAMLQNSIPMSWGQRDRVLNTEDPVEQQYQYCYPPPQGYATSPIAQEMIERRREKQTLDALTDLVRHLDGLREERKAILIVSEGWLLFRENRALAEIATPTMPGIGVGPTGRLDTTDRNNPYQASQGVCDRDRMTLANLDDQRTFRDLLDEANRANASFYPIDPRGLPVFDTDIGPNPTPSLTVDAAMLTGRLDSLRTAAENTDGVAVINSNNIEGGLRRVVSDLTSYYLIGYTSTNSKADGTFRSIRVRVKRPGIDVRSRRGYKAPTAAEVKARAAAPAALVVDEASAALTRAVSSLAGIRPNALFRLNVSPGWWTPPGEPIAGKPPGAEPALWIYGELDIRRGAGEDWSQGGEADIAILSAKGDVITNYTVAVPVGAGSFLSRFPRSTDDVWLDPGAYAVRVRVKPVAGGLPTTDTARFELPKAPAAGVLLLGQPVYARRGAAASAAVVATADLRFRRTERIVVDTSSTLKPDGVEAELLDRGGKPIAVTVAVTTSEKDQVTWVRSELALAPLAAGDYVIRITAIRRDERAVVLAAFRVVN
jgi:VWFA-related protein